MMAVPSSPCRGIEDFNGDARGVWERCCQGTVDPTLYRDIEQRGGLECPNLSESPFPFPNMAPFTGTRVNFSSGLEGTFDSCRYASDPPPGTFVYSNPLKKVVGDLSVDQQRAMCSMVKKSIEMSGPVFPSASTTSRVFLNFVSDSHAVAPMITRTNISQRIRRTTELVPCTEDDTEIDKDPSNPGMCKRTVGGEMWNARWSDDARKACEDAIEERVKAMKYVTQGRFYSWLCNDSKVRTNLFITGQDLRGMCTGVPNLVKEAATNVGLANAKLRKACSAVTDSSGVLRRLLDNVILLTSEGSGSRVDREDDVRVESLLKFPQINESGVNLCKNLPASIHDSIFNSNESPLLGQGFRTRRLLKECSFDGKTKMSDTDINRLFDTLTYKPCAQCSVDINPDINLPGLVRLWPDIPDCGDVESAASSTANDLDILILSLQQSLSENPLFRQDDNKPLLGDACESLRLSPMQRYESQQTPLMHPGLWGLEYERWIKCASSNESNPSFNEHWAVLGQDDEGAFKGKEALATAVTAHRGASRNLVLFGKLPGLRTKASEHCARDANFNRDRLNMLRDNWVTTFGVIGKHLNPSTNFWKSGMTGYAGLDPCKNNIDPSFMDLHFQ